jgi:hypothetical protein
LLNLLSTVAVIRQRWIIDIKITQAGDFYVAYSRQANFRVMLQSAHNSLNLIVEIQLQIHVKSQFNIDTSGKIVIQHSRIEKGESATDEDMCILHDRKSGSGDILQAL